MMTFPRYGKIKAMFQTTNQYESIDVHRDISAYDGPMDVDFTAR